MDNINLIRSIAWSFYKSYFYRIEWEELFAEACLAYFESLQSFDSGKGCKQSTWAFRCMKNKLIYFCKKEIQNIEDKDIDWYDDLVVAPEYEVFERTFRTLPRSDAFKAFSKDTRTIINLVSRDWYRYASYPKKTTSRIRESLRKKEWAGFRINRAIRILKQELSYK